MPRRRGEDDGTPGNCSDRVTREARFHSLLQPYHFRERMQFVGDSRRGSQSTNCILAIIEQTSRQRFSFPFDFPSFSSTETLKEFARDSMRMVGPFWAVLKSICKYKKRGYSFAVTKAVRFKLGPSPGGIPGNNCRQVCLHISF